MGSDPGPIEGHHGAPEVVRAEHELAFRQRGGPVASMQLAVGVVVIVAIAVVVAVGVVHAIR